MKKALRRVSVLSGILLILAGVLITKTYAHFIASDEIVNTIILGNVEIEVEEEFTSPENWDGKKVDKVVKIANKSNVNALIRVAIIPRWVDNQGNPWPGDTNIISCERVNIIDLPNINPNNKWVYGNDGYYYYNTVVPTGEATVEILNSLSASIPEELKNRYKDKTLIVDVKAEAVQAAEYVYKASWSNIQEGSELMNMLNNLCTQ